MYIEECPEVAQELLQQAIGRRHDRKPGWHQSDVNQCLRKSVVDRWLREEAPPASGYPKGLRHLDYDYRLDLKFLRGEGMHNFFSEGKPEFVQYDPNLGWYSIDRVWEEGVTLRLSDGRVYHMDAVPMELKTTDYSMTKPVPEMMTYLTQIATYTIKWVRYQLPDLSDDDIGECDLHAYLYIYHNRGDYKGNMPDHRAFKITWRGTELLEWEAELTRRHTQLDRSYGDLVVGSREDWGGLPNSFDDFDAPHISDHYGFECDAYGRCPLKDMMGCQGTEASAAWDRVPFGLDGVAYMNPVKESKPKGGK